MIKKTFESEMIHEFTKMTEDYEVLTIVSKKNIFSVVYRPPSGSVTAFLQFLDTFISWVNDNNFNLVLGGDINMNMLNMTTDICDLVTMLESHACINTVKVPTRIQANSATLLDIFITNVDPTTLLSGVIGCHVSDHLPTFLILDERAAPKPNTEVQVSTFQDINPLTLQSFRNELSLVTWQAVYSSTDPNDAYERFLSIFKSIYAEHFARKTARPKKARKPWISKEILKLIKEKDALYRRFLRSRNLNDLHSFKVFRNKVTKCLKQAKKNYFHSLFNTETMKRSAKVWQNLNFVLGRARKQNETELELTLDGVRLSGADLANTFNDFFVSLTNSTYCSRSLDYMHPRNSESAFLRPTDAQEIHSTFVSLRNSKCTDADDLQILPVKHVLDIISPVLAHVYNLIFTHAIFPRRMQEAKVSVLFKGGDQNNLSNYRPISIIPIFSKCIEKLINERMTSFCDKHQIITTSQFGFRKGRSAELALLTQKELILDAIESKLLTLGVFIDFSKAFDRINHDILIRKLEIYGFRGIFLDLITSYLQHRKQHVAISNQTSCTKNIKCGVPQGSILGPLLFNLYINDVVNITDSAQFVIYADDTSLFFTSSNALNLISKANDVLNVLNDWSLANSLAINVTKTKAVLFRPRNQIVNTYDRIMLGNSPVEIVPTFKSLGVIFEETLSWNNHVNKVASKISSVAGILTKLRSFLPTSIKLLIYNSLFLSHLNYCHLVWGPTTTSNLNKLFLLQKKAVRAITNSSYDAHTEPLFEQLNIATVKCMYNNILLKRFLTANRQNNNCYKQLSHLSINTSNYETRHTEKWRIPRARTNYGFQMLRYTLPKLLNTIA